MANYNSTYTGAEVDAAAKLAKDLTHTATEIDTAVTKANAITSTASEIDTAVGNATKVVANPTLAGTEADLTGLEVNGTKYAVPSGGSAIGSMQGVTITAIGNDLESLITDPDNPVLYGAVKWDWQTSSVGDISTKYGNLGIGISNYLNGNATDVLYSQDTSAPDLRGYGSNRVSVTIDNNTYYGYSNARYFVGLISTSSSSYSGHIYTCKIDYMIYRASSGTIEIGSVTVNTKTISNSSASIRYHLLYVNVLKATDDIVLYLNITDLS